MDDSDYIEMTAEEWAEAERRALERVGLTKDELRQQAKEGRFDSIEARKLWLIIGD